MSRRSAHHSWFLLSIAFLAAMAGCGDDDNGGTTSSSGTQVQQADSEFTTISPTGTIEYLGREYTPICADGSPYHFFIKRGSVNKLLMYYQSGGACWETLTCSFPNACDKNVDPNGTDNPNNLHTGFFDLTNPENPFRDWDIVFVAYCTCDVHFGDVARDYPPHIEHRGFHNARVAEKWAHELFPNPEVVFVAGSSAGAYGAQFHVTFLQDAWPNAQFFVLADAGNGVITQQFLDENFPSWNFAANLPTNIPGLNDVLHNGSGLAGYTQVVAKHFPRSRWGQYATAYDGGVGGQSSYYNIMLNNNNPAQGLFWWNATCKFNAKMRAQDLEIAAGIPSNYRYYIGSGSRHTMWDHDKVYADTTGGVLPVVDWINAMLAGSAAWTNVECTNCGLTLPGDPVPMPLQAPFKQVGSDVVVDCGGQ